MTAVCRKGHQEGKTKDGKCRRCAYDRNNAWTRRQPEEWKAKRRARSRELSKSLWGGRHRKRKYGLSQAQFDAMKNGQGHRCAICGTEEKDLPQSSKTRVLHVDHCHTTGAIRGLLCFACNSGLGYFRDSPRRLEAAIAYILRNAAEAEDREVPHPT